MKNVKKMMLPLIAGLFVVSCNDANKDADMVATDSSTVITAPVATDADFNTTEGKAVVIAETDVPAPVRTSFTTKYPTIQTVEWVSYEPTEWDEWTINNKYYYVKYSDQGTEYLSWYDADGNWVKTSTRVTGDPNLPDAVNKTINEKFAGYEIVEIDKENDKDRDLFEIELKKGEAKAKLKILPTGEIVKQKL